MKGIYQYTDLKTGEVVYVGKDSHIDKNQRHKDHLAPSKYNHQQINRVLQNNPNRYEYGVIWATEDCTELKLNKMEILFGKIYNPKFNFGEFGKGGCKKHSEETKKKMSENHVDFSGENNPMYDKHHTDEAKLKISKAKNTSGYYRVSKTKDKNCKQGFRWFYQYKEDDKRICITSVSLEKLEKKVKEKGLKWRCL